MQKAAPIIRTKIHLPFIRPGLVPRPRLQEQVAKGLRGPLTLIIAPAGFGKTTLAAACIAGCGMPVAWLSLDKEDNRMGRFLSYLIAALQNADEDIGQEAAQLAAEAQPVPPEMILTSLINDLDAAGSAGKEIVLVVDDYHFVNNQEVNAAVVFLLENCPRTLHLVVASRSDPPLPVARWRARGQAVELRAADLSFTVSEAAQFLNEVMGLRLDTGEIALLEERTEGWIAGLQMAALSMRDRKDVSGFIEGFSGTNRYILDYLLEEVLASQPPEIQDFLLCTSVLTRLTAPLCDALLEDEGGAGLETEERAASTQPAARSPSTATLEYLERGNLFLVPLDDERRWYRYHRLFADLLESRLRQAGAGAAERLLARAAEWCERDGEIADAVGYALAAQDYKRAGELTIRYWPSMANSGEIETLWSWLEALPRDMIRGNAPLGVATCWALWLKGQVGAMEAHLLEAENAARQRTGSAEDLDAGSDIPIGMPALLATLRSIVARYNNDFIGAVAHSERALHLIPKNLSPQSMAQLHGTVLVALASAYDGAGDLEKAVGGYRESIQLSRVGVNAGGVAGMTYRLIGALQLLGRLREAEEACRDALRTIEDQGMARLSVNGILHLRMSELLLERNDLEGAEAHLSQGIELGKLGGRFDAARNAYPALSRLRLARGDANGALSALREAEMAMEKPPSPLAKAELQATRARVLLHQGAVAQASQCAEEAVLLAGRDRGQTGEMAALASCRVMAAQGKPEEAIRGLTRSLSEAESSKRLGAAIQLLILRSLAQSRAGATREAQTDLERALLLGEPEGYARVFLDEGQPMQMLLAQWLAHASAGALREYAARLLGQFGAEAEGRATPAETGELMEPLSQRELEVLHLMALGRTNLEIARQLIVARGTVKAHTASIFRKLDVGNRTEAVARARELKILP